MAKSNSLKSGVIEVLSIVLGVLVALGANEWNENRIHRARADEAVSNIARELVQNQKLLDTVHRINSNIVTSILSQNATTEDTQFTPGLQVQNTAWNTMIATGVAEHIEYKVLHSISAAYSFQQIYRELSYQMIQNFVSTSALATAIKGEGKAELPNDLFLENMQLVVLTEEGLMAHYTAALDELKERGYLASLSGD